MSVLPELPSNWAGDAFVKQNSITEPVKRAVEPVGPGFLAHARRTLKGRTWSEDEKIQAETNVQTTESNEDADYESEPETEEMLERDAKDWKGQDHYAVLGLSKLRYRADEEQIRQAHRRKVLKHHPDKKASQGHLMDDSFFKCIQKAFEQLMDPVKRRQWDSVDPKASVLPKKNAQGDFISLWKPVFDAEAHFSIKQPVPSLGSMESTKEEVDEFYNFWYNFESWKTFEYLDEDVPDDTSNRDNKRYIEKKNKNARAKRKTDDAARLRKWVDTALKADPRLKMFKEAEKKKKEQEKWDREAESRAAAEAAKKAAEEAEQQKKAAEEAAKSNKKNKEAAKAAKKKNKRSVRGSLKEVNYFHPAGEDVDAGEMDSILKDVDGILEGIDDTVLQTLATKLEGVTIADGDKVKAVFTEAVAASKITPAYFK